MSNSEGRRQLFGTALGLAAVGATLATPALAQTLGGEPDPRSALTKVRKEGKLRIGYAQTAPWFFKDVKSGSLSGIYYDVVQEMCAQLGVKAEYQEVSWQDSTVALRRGDFDVFASSLTYTVPRAAVIYFPQPPLWQRGSLALIHKDNVGKWKTAADLNNPDVTISVNVGTSAESLAKQMFPKAKLITTTGQILTAVEPVRTKRADVWLNGDNDVVVFAHKNADWAAILDEAHPFAVSPNTWALRYGDPDWQGFVNSWCAFAVANGMVKERYDHYMELALKD
jgi:ABC-type amino acid transport substrate-binding protein